MSKETRAPSATAPGALLCARCAPDRGHRTPKGNPMRIRSSWAVAGVLALALSVGGAAGYAVGSTANPTDAEAQAALDLLQTYLDQHKSPSPSTTPTTPTTTPTTPTSTTGTPTPTASTLADCAPTTTWEWANCPAGQSSVQTISGTVSGITDADHNASFVLGATDAAGTGGVRLIVRGGGWAIESASVNPSGALTTGTGGVLKATRSGNVFKLFYNGAQVTQQTIAGTYGNYLVPGVWQSSAGVAIRSITYGDGSTPSTTPTGPTTTPTTPSTTPPAGGGGFKLGVAGTGAGNGAADRWMVGGPGVLKSTATWIDVYAGDAGNLTGEFGSWGTQPGQLIDVATGGFYSGHGLTANWAAAANGTWDSFWQTRLTQIKNAWGTRPVSNLRIRPFHEFTGTWFEWSVSGGDATNFVAAFRRYAGLVRATLPGAKIVWSPANSYGSYDPASFWPGSAYADVVGPDTYNQWPHSVTVAQVQADQINQAGIGMEAWRQRAAAWGVPMALPEWGNPAIDSGGGAGGGDAPNYVTEVFKWAKANGCAATCAAGQVEYGVYFNIGIDGGYPAHFQMFDGSGADSRQPQTGNAFRNFVNVS